jgi:hypothetical protein
LIRIEYLAFFAAQNASSLESIAAEARHITDKKKRKNHEPT